MYQQRAIPLQLMTIFRWNHFHQSELTSVKDDKAEMSLSRRLPCITLAS